MNGNTLIAVNLFSISRNIAADLTKLAADYGQLQEDMPAGGTGHK
jgi:hypothetical protein